MRKTEVIVSNKKLFSNSGGLGPVRVGSEDWQRAKERQERVQSYFIQAITKPSLYSDDKSYSGSVGNSY